MLYSLTYASWATQPFSTAALVRLLSTARHNNFREGVTGMLLYREGTFMQALEGEEEAVRKTFARIVKDRRHEHATVLEKGPVEKRLFEGWAMSFALTNATAHVPGYSGFMGNRDWLTQHPSKAAELLNMFKALKPG